MNVSSLEAKTALFLLPRGLHPLLLGYFLENGTSRELEAWPVPRSGASLSSHYSDPKDIGLRLGSVGGSHLALSLTPQESVTSTRMCTLGVRAHWATTASGSKRRDCVVV